VKQKETSANAAIRILVVEDSPTQLEELRFLLEEEGYSVLTATNGMRGLAAAKANAVALVISDIVMPEMDGYELSKALRADPGTRHLPVILLTSLSDPRDVILGLEAGASNFICKPYDGSALVARIRNVLANEELRRSSSSEMGINIFFAGQRFFITADRLQILDLLLSTYENAVTRNSELGRARDELRSLNEKLEARVAERTAALALEMEEHKRVEAERGRLATAIEQAAETIVITDVKGDIEYVNPAFEAVTGYAREDVLGKNPRLLQSGMQDQIFYHNLWDTLTSGKTWQGRFVNRKKDGTHYTEDATISPVRDPAGVTVSYVAVKRDITEHERMEAKLKESHERYQSLFHASQDGIALADADTAMIVDCNAALLRMVGRTRHEVVGQHQKILHPPQDGDVDESFRVHREQKPESPIETQLVTKTGSLVDVEIKAGEVVIGGRRHLVGSFRDITERKRAEKQQKELTEQLRASQKMEAIGSLAGGVAHDFNNLLAVILSYTGFAAGGEGVSPQLRDDLLEVQKAADRAVALTRQLLAFSRKQVLQPVPLSLNQTATGLEKMLRRIIGEDIDLALVLDKDLGLTLADPGQIEQVIMNLVVNARDAMPEGGKLTIETSNVEIDEEYATRHVAVTPGSYVQLAVTDTGRGMDEQTKSRIFEPFFTTKPKGKGTGLGLSTVYGIVKQSGGNLWVYSELGQGTTFKIYLPRESSAVAAVTTAPVTPRPVTGTEIILVVEDEEALRKVAKRSLEAAGYTVLTAADGDEALQVSAQHAGDIHLLLTDVVMPRINGKTLAQTLSKTRPTLKVAYMSGYTDNAIVHHGVLDAGTHFIPKPFTGNDLTRKVREVLDAEFPTPPDGPEQPGGDDAEIKEPPLDKAALRTFPDDVLGRLRKAVVAARYDEIVEIIETIRNIEPKVATQLRRMADLFDYDRLRELLAR
jgi:PAS domain S-box-containing protein